MRYEQNVCTSHAIVRRVLQLDTPTILDDSVRVKTQCCYTRSTYNCGQNIKRRKIYLKADEKETKLTKDRVYCEFRASLQQSHFVVETKVGSRIAESALYWGE